MASRTKTPEEIAEIRERERGKWDKKAVQDYVTAALETGDWTKRTKRNLWEDHIKYSDCHISWQMYNEWTRDCERKHWLKLPADELVAYKMQELQDIVDASMKTRKYQNATGAIKLQAELRGLVVKKQEIAVTDPLEKMSEEQLRRVAELGSAAFEKDEPN
jgi:hypothetical protein